MEKIDKSISEDYGPVVLYIEDLEEMIDVFSESGGELEFISGDCKFDSIDELTDHFKNNYPNSVNLKQSKPYINVEIGENKSSLFASSSKEAAYIVYRLDKIIKSTQRRFPLMYGMNSIFYSAILMITA
jgi:hypothetical protein